LFVRNIKILFPLTQVFIYVEIEVMLYHFISFLGQTPNHQTKETLILLTAKRRTLPHFHRSTLNVRHGMKSPMNQMMKKLKS